MAAIPSMPLSTANWHWKNKNVTAWAKSWFERELVTLAVKGEGEEVASVKEVLEVDGDVELGQRKSKLITIYDCKVRLKWAGVAKDGTEVEGNLTIPEVSHEITLDGLSDYVYNWSLTTASSPAVDAIFKLAKSLLPTALETKFAEFPSALIDTHGKDLTISAQPSRTGTPAPPGVSGTSTPASTTLAGAAATADASTSAKPPAQEKEKKKDEKATNTTTVTVDATFMASAQDLFELMTDAQRIPLWTRAPAHSNPQPHAEYSLFGGGVTGEYLDLKPAKEIKQTWSLKSPTWPEGIVTPNKPFTQMRTDL
ncbi:hypothetical protein NLI96_g9575 [Meripilus lineatus]|uniref:Activator of Hsp90 ATPase AHSA1-like N-terminal domain-containing protein n=1 Tax=Meripilus lineatus TaxID=2056292 RepID=A0AAD5UVG7_9APHY|nr:hypothetical protein NLI96_g9575 [Physisporinus lineatus]